MEFWANIVNTALLGTSKKPLTADELTAELKGLTLKVNASTVDEEVKFLQIAALSFNYRQCGGAPLKVENIQENIAPAEDKTYCSTAMLQCLREILHEENEGLLKEWLRLCMAGGYIVSPEFIPGLFSLAEKNKNLRSLIISCCGKRGEWLSQFNTHWNFYTTESINELWETGSLEQRKEILRSRRKMEPAKAREALQQVWSQENANAKQELLKEMVENLSLEDEPWLQTLLKEKSVRIKEETLTLLKQLPDSMLVKSYQEILKESLFMKKEKAMLGLMSKVKLELKMSSSIDETVVASGIDKLSNTKGVSDEEYVVAQLLNYIPPAFLETYYGLSAEEIILTFGKEKAGKNFLPALASAVALFKDQNWALAFAKNADHLYSDIAFLLPKKEFEEYLMKHFEQYPNDSMRLALQAKEEWSVKFAMFVLSITSKNSYQYNRNFYNQLTSLLPVGIKEELKKIIVTEEYHRSSWENMLDHINNLVSIKEQTIQSFN